MSNLIDSHLIGQSIKALRLKNHLTQDGLAYDIGYSTRNLRRIETDGTTSIEVVNTFAEYFKVSAIDILNGCFFVFFRNTTDNSLYGFYSIRDILISIILSSTIHGASTYLKMISLVPLLIFSNQGFLFLLSHLLV